MELTVREICDISKMPYSTMQFYLEHVYFNKFRIIKFERNRKYIVTSKFIDTLESFLTIKGNKDNRVRKLVRDCQPIDRLRIALRNCAEK